VISVVGSAQAGPQHVERAGEVEGQEPLTLGGLERRAELGRGPTSHFEQRLGQGSAQGEGVHPDLLDQPGPGFLGPGQAACPA